MNDKKSSHQPRPKISLVRALSKLGFCSRRQAEKLINSERVSVNGQLERDPTRRLDLAVDHIEVDGKVVQKPKFLYLMLNKPRGLVTTRSDEKGRATVYSCFKDANLPWVAPVGRLDRASEGLLLFTNDTRWAARLLNPDSHIEKTYHVQIDCIADDELLKKLREGIPFVSNKNFSAVKEQKPSSEIFSPSKQSIIAAKRVSVLRSGVKNCWLEIVLEEGKNRQIRRMLQAYGIKVLRLVRVAIGSLTLGNLPKGSWRYLTRAEIEALKRQNHPKQKHLKILHSYE